jgi:hypothetical protein
MVVAAATVPVEPTASRLSASRSTFRTRESNARSLLSSWWLSSPCKSVAADEEEENCWLCVIVSVIVDMF